MKGKKGKREAVVITINYSALTKREMEVLRFMATGKSSKTIAKELFISNNTIEAHRKNILKKMDAKNMVEAIATAFREGIIQ
jgi:DNA-binding NarL/FixJ family response regulator